MKQMVFIVEPGRYGYDFIPKEFIPPGKDEYWIRNTQVTPKAWRRLEPDERKILTDNNNTCPDWDNFLVSDPFDPSLIRDSNFFGLVRIGALRNVMLRHHDFVIQTGIRNSTIISCDIGDDTAVHDCSYISHYVIGNSCILFHIDEMQTTNHSKFGNGALMDGEDENLRIWIDVMNEAGGRSILPFREMLCADAYLWAAYRDDTALTDRLKEITQKEYGGHRGAYGVVGSHSVIKSCGIIKDVFIGECAYIKGANKLKNISVFSTEDEPTQIGEGVEMVNGIINPGCNAFYGIKAVRFVMGRCSSLKYGARLIHSVLGDNSTVSCCEILNNLIFPGHEQHHNNSFLIASLIQGMSNMAAAATIGSNHNSRANDGEIRAGRGFWPGLSVSLKHPSRFASFILIAKGDYPYELNIGLPFSLVNNNTHLDRLEVMPAYFWMYNLYNLERNSWKTRERDKRVVKKQRIETDYLAPDTAEEIISALSQMELWMTAAGYKSRGIIAASVNFPSGDEDPGNSPDSSVEAIPASSLECHSRSTVLLKPYKAWAAYNEMLLYYSLKTLAEYLIERKELSFDDFVNEMERPREDGNRRVSEWVNLGGQITPAFRVDEPRDRIRRGEAGSWESIHAAYDDMAAAYPLDKVRHAWEVYRYLERQVSADGGPGHPLMDKVTFKKEMEMLVSFRHLLTAQVLLNRSKDYDNPFRRITFRNKQEMEQVLGNAGDNSFIRYFRKQAESWEGSLRTLVERLS